MKTLTLIPLLLILSIFFKDNNKAIYNNDDRTDVKNDSKSYILSNSIAVMIASNNILTKANGNYKILDYESLSESGTTYVCKDQKFSSQPTIGRCTGFLVAPNILATAGHCVLNTGKIQNLNNEICQNFKWYFKYRYDLDNNLNLNNINKDQIYRCKKIIIAKNIEIQKLNGEIVRGEDFALIELDRNVINIDPLKITSHRPKEGEIAFTIGHPSGLPAKDSGTSKVINISTNHSFSIFLDTLGGNSGGPVFNKNLEATGILVSGHQHDYYQTSKGCWKVNRCNNKGEDCDEKSDLQKYNNISFIDLIIPYLNK